MEERGIRSKRKFDGLQYFKKTKKRLAQKELPFAPLSWDVKLGSLCNLKCRMCSPYPSSEVMSEQLAESWIEYPEAKKDYIRSTKNFFENPEFKRELLKLLPFAEEIYFSGGEPSLLTDHLECLDEAIRLGLTDQIRVRWSTNLTRFDHRFTDRASKFKNIVLDCGVDGYGKVCEYIRYPVSWLQIEERLAEIRTALPLAEVKVICAVQVYNAFSLDRLIEWGEQGGHQIVFNYVNQPSCYSTQSLPPESKQRLARQYSGLQHEKLEEFLLWTQGPGDPEAMREFLLRTERLDRVRKQDFWTLAPEGLQNELMSFVGHQTERHPS